MNYIIHYLDDVPVDEGLSSYVYLLEHPDSPERVTEAQFADMGKRLGPYAATVRAVRHYEELFCTDVIHAYVAKGDPPEYRKFPALLVTHVPPNKIQQAKHGTEHEPTYELIPLGPLTEAERWDFMVDLCDAIRAGTARIGSLKEDIDSHPKDTKLSQSMAKLTRELGSLSLTDLLSLTDRFRYKVFIIHGHNLAAARELQNLLREELDLDGVMLKDEPEAGRTAIEKFEDCARNCEFAFALFTPDDTIIEEAGELYSQARPNALFELGWFYGNTGRKCTAILLQKGTKLPTDLDGLITLCFHDSVTEVSSRIRKELKQAGVGTLGLQV